MPRKFASSIDLTLKEHHEGYHMLTKIPASVGYSNLVAAERKRGATATQHTQNSTALAAKKQAKAMALATKPGQQVMMNAFMMYMSGKNLNIFSISTTATSILTPVTSIFKMESTFGSLDVDTTIPKLIFVAINLAWLLIGMYKMSSMRLLPTSSSDFTDSIVWKDMMETTSIPPVF
mmetsp:Transcript_126165/g.188271  ORF Transcript_126165/g.188271 Transcript_126165/m.188271 type:complete len:177 (-) Transcript_126165:35-565(-)|eukprot:CAMPEP_0117034308 /NCGR_PEP_ID=MMETSP0472-20121206/24438_1 /TAXON_ID=693140 ORGANISM="Tiarina fusus, Strain LIS" /NCGR_SAMPLE_ID=MMETSP0472 /ASSEMBLY_ACC=CAM_ASM_000603 /LENGTH=176 /DNA_ID=CAMNT_0004743447 /DNA_START=113 /DNA_END=643 /DNA_ORIENTATION=-